MRKASLLVLAILSGMLAFPSVSFGTMSSTNYTIFADSIDTGGLLSTGGAYSLQDTTGESPVGSASSSIYEVIGGYQAMDWRSISISANTAAISLGSLTMGEVATSSVVIHVTTDNDSGYVLSVGSVSGTSLSGVSDGSVSPGAEEYGVAVSGTDAAFSDDRTITAGLNLASTSTAVTGAQTTLVFKASLSSISAAGSYSQSITLTAATNI